MAKIRLTAPKPLRKVLRGMRQGAANLLEKTVSAALNVGPQYYCKINSRYYITLKRASGRLGIYVPDSSKTQGFALITDQQERIQVIKALAKKQFTVGRKWLELLAAAVWKNPQ